jgi:ABC-type antimicrobial peptide transport system permease subunit
LAFSRYYSRPLGLAITRVKRLDSQLTDSLAAECFQTLVLLAFAAAALLLAMLGIYGVLNYAMVSRSQEIGVRIALGATRRQIYTLIFSEGESAVLGLAAGLIVSMFAGRLIQNLLRCSRHGPASRRRSGNFVPNRRLSRRVSTRPPRRFRRSHGRFTPLITPAPQHPITVRSIIWTV